MRFVKTKLLLALILVAELASVTTAQAARIKDIANVRGVRENQLIGYGLVVGLSGTGDGKAEYLSKSFSRMLDNLGLKLDNRDVESKNIAAVIVTATLPPFSKSGNKIDVTVSSIGSASSLQGGMLLQTPLKAADQQVYAVAQGSIAIGGSSAGGGGGGAGAEKPVLTVARIPDAAIIETDLNADFTNRRLLRLTLNNPDFTTAARMVKVINEDLGGKYASAKDSGTIDIVSPFSYEGNTVELIAGIENLNVTNDQKAKVIVNEKTGTVVIGEHVQISTVALTHGNLSIQIKGDGGVPARGPASAGQGGGAGGKGASGGNLAVIKKSADVGELVKALNSLGVTPKDLISILQSLKAAGAIQAEIQIL